MEKITYTDLNNETFICLTKAELNDIIKSTVKITLEEYINQKL